MFPAVSAAAVGSTARPSATGSATTSRHSAREARTEHLPGRAAKHGVHQPRASGADRLDQLDALVDRSVVGDRVEVQQLVEADADSREHRWLEPRERSADEPPGDVVEGEPSLDGAVGDLHRERPVAPPKSRMVGLRRERRVLVRQFPCGSGFLTASSQTRGDTKMAQTGLPSRTRTVSAARKGAASDRNSMTKV